MWKIVPIALIQSVFLALGQVFLKLALAKMGDFAWKWKFLLSQLTNWWWLGCGLSFLVASLLWFYILKHFPFSIAYPMSSLSYVMGMLAAIFIFGEQVPLVRWLGILLILLGCVLIAR
jgi:drug/metabolite transporter (DMT)-like permease